MQLLENITLGKGGHRERGTELCVMEAVAYIAGEPHSDHPACACPVITKFLITWNDDLPTDADRERLLKPLIPLLVGTKSTPEIEAKRVGMAVDWLLREYAPAWLELAGLKSHADSLRINPTLDVCREAQKASAAARDAAWDSARAAARDAARAAARAAAWDAARAAASAAASAALNPTVEKLQLSAVELVKRMIAAK